MQHDHPGSDSSIADSSASSQHGPVAALSIRRRSRFERDYVAIVAAFAVLMVLTNMIGTKLFVLLPDWLPQGFGPITDYHYVILTTGLVTYPLTFLFTDVCSEVWGRRRANYMVLLGFACSVLMLVVVHVAQAMPRADRYWADAASQPIHGAHILESAAAGSTVVTVDDAQHLILADGESGTALALIAEGAGYRTIPFRYHHVQQPVHTIPGENGLQEVPLRWDQRAALQLTSPLTEAIPAHSWILPAVRIVDRLETGAVQVDRPWLLPASTIQSTGLLAQDGVVLHYAQRDATTGVVMAETVWNSPVASSTTTLARDAVLGIYQLRSPAALNQAFRAVFSAPGSLLVASMLAYLLAQFLDVWLFHFWRRVTKGRYLWLRNNGSTMISQLADTIVVNGIFLPWAFGMPFEAVVKVIIGVYLVKMVLAWIDTPIIYLAIWIAKRRLGYTWYQDVASDELQTASGYPTGLRSTLCGWFGRHDQVHAQQNNAPSHVSAADASSVEGTVEGSVREGNNSTNE